MDELFMGRDAWKNNDMAISDAKAWLADIPINSSELPLMLDKLAVGGYPKLQASFNEFLIALYNSKHKHSDQILSRFFSNMITEVSTRLNFESLPRNFAEYIRRHRQ